MIYILPTDTCLWIACSIDDTTNYHKIYEIKKRDLSKPLSIMIENFDWLLNNTSLSWEQVEFLKNYEKPFTILTNCPHIEMILNLEQEDFEYKNKEVYTSIGFRVAHNEIQRKLINEIWPIFLTSANISWEKEIYDINEAKKLFTPFIKDIQFLWEGIKLNEMIWPSDIFRFTWENLEIEYIRK